jgi:pimeloyl-ACP methyl ester carboxylesterase
VGSSSGGMVITGVAERVPERIGHLMYMDAFVPQDGQSIADLLGPEVIGGMEQAAQAHGEGWRIPFGDPGADRRTDVMLKVAKQPLSVSNPDAARLRRTYVLHTGKSAEDWLKPVFERIAERVRQKEGWSYHERPYVHYPVLDQPGGSHFVAQLLMEFA